MVLAFGIPPRHADEPWRMPVLLTTREEKLNILSQLGIDHVRILTFDRKTASTPPERFFLNTIVRKCGAQEMIVGPRVAFGKNRAGRLAQLRQLGRRYQVRIQLVRNIKGPSTDISSRRIRAFLRKGDLHSANLLLGYPYSAVGRVVHGDHRGHHLGFPTANLAVSADKILPPGVYWVKVLPGHQDVPLSSKALIRGIDGLCNVGIHPTFTPLSHEIHCEVFLLGYHKMLYGKTLRVVFLRKIRKEKRFSSAEALVAQIQRDVAKTRRWARVFFTK
jgi:riboflavin kinase/FMN adenylyltransferase